MDFSIGDIIFFGAIAIAVISNIVKQLKKSKQQPPQRQSVPVPVPAELEDYFQKVKTKKEAPVQKKSSIISPQHDTTEKQIEETFFEEELSVEEDDFVLDFSDASEVKKGIIYAEIFNRKYSN